MFIDKSRESFSKIQEFEKWLEANGYSKNDNFFSIEELWEKICFCMKNNKFNIYFPFNGKFVIFDSTPFTEDDLYLFITGKTKKEREDEHKKRIEEIENREKEYQNKLPDLIKEYKEKMRGLTEEKFFNKVDEVVELSLRSMYHNFLMDSLIEIMKIKDATFEEIENKLYEQGHSGYSYSLTCFMFKEISDKGKEFAEWKSKNG